MIFGITKAEKLKRAKAEQDRNAVKLMKLQDRLTAARAPRVVWVWWQELHDGRIAFCQRVWRDNLIDGSYNSPFIYRPLSEHIAEMATGKRVPETVEILARAAWLGRRVPK